MFNSNKSLMHSFVYEGIFSYQNWVLISTSIKCDNFNKLNTAFNNTLICFKGIYKSSKMATSHSAINGLVIMYQSKHQLLSSDYANNITTTDFTEIEVPVM
ncbi:hypothetical protein HS088_TW23G00709 [Tripterygium wilfordii]|uniref:Uncharacterized protein n=1 Tax=Tripterygium wilfordii TaxID=458696 RepID=A0A7J7BVS0_TRIWF|nr:hypothetical protein HS088_TW23G00709 [Tripterygium wilfordii]